ncbi:MAG: hypothetical protein UT20_C0024G0007 [Candidatus Levybacteria bacterium GW2011_GWA1_39_11]|uniref:Uncharacterized protein n=1 Tax=Candidatus Giovannonibacteria bacterium GW2011_GWA2_45_21 TaxID=1618649 RepID=A0A0G1MAG5_9BACT|nr:MAG: hypothetical protein UT20_C0024G0007 [Candidatus Levybacteria bacterium GW2011_GWA1_39_11]KKU05261.1 MAG: hypothetical protein UX06_C0001G0022 [Candidatus Giovannonibacteria bacterium GW2011_GWA2_45_21]
MSELNIYKIEHKILTLAHCAVMEKKDEPASFDVDGVKFSHWDFNYVDGWKTDISAWIASSEIASNSFIDAINIFTKKLSKLIPRISLICQSYIEFTVEPFLIHEISKDVAFFKYIEDVRGGGLMFMEKEQKALKELLSHTEIPEEFYYYWNDAVNAVGHSAKLLLMFSAIEALVKRNGNKDWTLINKILGKDLVEELFGTKEQSNTGLRHRLVHGEYFGNQDNGKNYLELIHNKVVHYFNTNIFSKSLLQEGVTHPQRHFFGNKREGRWFVKRKDGISSFSLKDLLSDFNENGFRTPKSYEIVFNKNLSTTY